MTSQPFSEAWQTPFQIPPFDTIETAHFRPAFDVALLKHRAEIDALIGNPDAASFANTIEALELAGQDLLKVSRVFYNLTGTMSDDGLRAVAIGMAAEIRARASLRDHRTARHARHAIRAECAEG